MKVQCILLWKTGKRQLWRAAMARHPATCSLTLPLSRLSVPRLRSENPRYFASSAVPVSTSSITPFLLADIGEGIHEVELLKWYIQPGDVVQQFDNVCQVQSDKATVNISSRFDGVVTELSGHVGDMIKVGQPLLYLETG